MSRTQNSFLLPAVSLILLALSACSSLPERADLQTPSTQGAVDADSSRLERWIARQYTMQQLKQWRAEGRAAILAQNGGGQISFDWRHSGQDQVLSIKTPLGQNALQLTINQGGVTLIDHEGQVLQGDDAESMLQQTLGWSLPLASMRAWLLGLPASAEDSYTLDAQGRPLTLESRGWSIDYKRYGEVGNYSLPNKLELRHSQLTLRLVVDQWSL